MYRLALYFSHALVCKCCWMLMLYIHSWIKLIFLDFSFSTLFPTEKIFCCFHFTVIVTLIRMALPGCQTDPAELETTSARHVHASLIFRNDFFAARTWLCISSKPTFGIITINLFISFFSFTHALCFIIFLCLFEILLTFHTFCPQVNHLTSYRCVRFFHAFEAEIFRTIGTLNVKECSCWIFHLNYHVTVISRAPLNVVSQLNIWWVQEKL